MTVTVYTKENCQPCKATVRFLTENGIEFQERSTADPHFLAEAKALGYSGAPVVAVEPSGVVSEADWYGFRPDLLGELITATAG